MWRQQKKENPLVSLALLLTLATIPTAATLLVPVPMLAKSSGDVPAFPLPQSVESGTTVRIDGSDSLRQINQGLKQSFEQQFAGTKVEVTASGTDSALKALQDGKVDLVALSRGLTPQEKAQGLEQVLLRREKIAIVVGAGNPFQGSLTNKQFLKIFRGEITDWAELGATKGKIRVIDRPTTSETRSNLRNYPAFKATNFVTGANATQLAEDNTAEMVKELGNDGISYGLANQLLKLESVRVLQINQASLDDAKYPFSQPLVYVYKKKLTPGVAGFLGFAIASPGQTAIDEARTVQAQAAIAATPAVATPSPIAEAITLPTVSPSEQPSAMSAEKKASPTHPTSFLWLLLLLPVIGGLLLWWFLRKRSSTDAATDTVPESTPNPAAEEETFPYTDSKLDEGTNLTASHTGENITSAASSAATDIVVPNATTENIVNSDPENSSNSAVTITPESGATAWEIEAPASIVNTPYPQLPDVPIVASDVQLPSTEVSTSNSKLTDLPEVASHTDNWNIESIQEFREEPLQTAGSIAENPTPTGGAVLAGGAAIAAGSAILSAASGTSSDIQENNETIQDSNFPELNSPKLPEITGVAELPTVNVSTTIPELPEITGAAELPTVDASTAVPELPELPEVELNAVADAAEPTANFSEEDTDEIVSNLPEKTNERIPEFPEALASGAALAAGVGIGAWASIYGIQNPSESDAQVESYTTDSPDEEIAASVVITPQSPTSVHVAWQISDTQQQAVSQLVLRLYDVTAVDLSYQVPHLVQQYELELMTRDRLVTIPTSDRDYITEIGYLTAGDHWVSIARSATVRVFSHPDIESETANSPDEEIAASVVITPQSPTSVHVAWQISDTQQQAVSQLVLRLYDVTGVDLSYQVPHVVQQYELESMTRDRLVTIPTSDRDYITEIGYLTAGDHWVSIARSATVRVFSHPNIESETANSPDEEIAASVVITPQSPTSVHVAWQISDTQQQAVSQLVLRLYDVTGVDLSYQVPHVVQQYELESMTRDRLVTIPTSDRDYITEIGYLTAGDHWVSIARSATVRVFSHPNIESETANSPDEEIAASVVITPRTPKWAYVSWQISDTQQQALQNARVSQLVLRLYDVTGVDLSYQVPHVVQQYELESMTRDRFVTIPTSDRDYITEIGYLTAGDRWVSIARSATVRVFSHPNIESETANSPDEEIAASVVITPRTPKWAYVSWQISDTQQQALQNARVSQLVLRLYDVTGVDLSYQVPHVVQQYELESMTRDRFVTIPTSDRDYITEIGYLTAGDRWVSIARSATVRVFSHLQPDFWFVADAELIIHGATEPNATVTIGQHTIKLKPDGTFHLRIPFSDSLIEYLITAAAADGRHTKTIHKKFSQETPET
jgi:phosphate transport system substrate-binding protein